MRRAALFSIVLAVGACSTASIGPPEPEDDDVVALGGDRDLAPPATAGDPDVTPVGVDEPETLFHGPYEITTTMDIAGSGVLGTHVGGTLVLLSEFHDNPAGTILGLLALYDFPIISTIYDLLPGFLEDEIEGWLNDAIFDRLFEGVPAVEEAVIFVDDVATVSRNVEMVSELTLERPNVRGRMRADHRMRGFGFTFRGARTIADVPASFAELTHAEPRADLEIVDSPNPTVPQGLLRIDRHSFSIPYGEMLLAAIAELVYEPAGVSSLGELLVLWVGCHSVAESVGDECVWGACVSDFISVSDIEAVCTEGLGLIGFVVEESVRGLRFDLVDFDDGRCELYDVGYSDASGDFVIDAIADGEWSLGITMFGTTYSIPNSFEGFRVR